MKASQLKILEAAFAAEVEDRLPFQRKGRQMEELASAGYLQPMEVTLPGRFPVLLKGWQLTHFGRMTYCATPK